MTTKSGEVILNMQASNDHREHFRFVPFESHINSVEMTHHSGRYQVTAVIETTAYAGYGKTIIEAFEDLTDNITSTFRRELLEIAIGFHQYKESLRNKRYEADAE